MKKERFIHLLHKHLSGSILPVENDELYDMLSTGEYDELIGSKILADLKEENKMQIPIPHHVSREIIGNILASGKKKIVPLNRWIAAACIIFLAVSIHYLRNTPILGSHPQPYTFSSLIPNDILHKKNETSSPLILVLPDSSRVTLQPRSTLHYASVFTNNKREVYLEGEAFFQVKKNPSKPFLVYSDNIVTRVLGTSFSVGINPKSGNIEVSVRTGRVQVFENAQLVKNAAADADAVILTPNRKAIYKTAQKEFETALVDDPLPLLNDPQDTEATKNKSQFVYDRSRISMILEQLKKYYGIEILVENENLNNCLFTGDLSAQDLYTKLKILTLTINASYEVNGTKILIRGPGCN